MTTGGFLIIKNYLRAALITSFFAALAICLPTEAIRVRDPESISGITEASIQKDILQGVAIVGLKEINGIKISHNDYGKYTYYFKYEADPGDTLKIIGNLPFVLDNNSSSVACLPMNTSSNPMDTGRALSDVERKASSFFWNSKPEEFIFYECIKSPLRHTLLISKSSSLILHRVETI